MNCSTARELFPELLDPRTAPAAQPPDAPRRSPQGEGGLDARAHLASCPDCQREFATLSQTLVALDAMTTPPVPSRLRKNFYAMLEEEKNSATSVRAATEREHRARRTTLWRWILPPAFAFACAIVAFQAGMRYAPVVPAPDDAMARKIAALEKQVGDVKNLVGYSILQQQQNPTAERLQEVLSAAKAENPGEKVLGTLVDALAFDPSTNIRLRALEALFQHSDKPSVRAGVINSLPREQNPLVQIELIEFVAATHDREATTVLETVARNESNDRSVRDAARRAIAQL